MFTNRPLIPASVAAALIAVGVAGGALAQAGGGAPGMGPKGPNLERMFAMIDADGDGKITKEEMQAAPQRRFEAADTDGDGKLTAAELTEARMEQARRRIEAKVQKMLKAMDKDGDGVLSAEEMGPAARAEARAEARRDRMFDRFDADDDGAVSRAEAEEAMAMMQQHRKGRGERMGGRGDRDWRRGECMRDDDARGGCMHPRPHHGMKGGMDRGDRTPWWMDE